MYKTRKPKKVNYDRKVNFRISSDVYERFENVTNKGERQKIIRELILSFVNKVERAENKERAKKNIYTIKQGPRKTEYDIFID